MPKYEPLIFLAFLYYYQTEEIMFKLSQYKNPYANTIGYL
jgi:hypothetical protein